MVIIVPASVALYVCARSLAARETREGFWKLCLVATASLIFINARQSTNRHIAPLLDKTGKQEQSKNWGDRLPVIPRAHVGGHRKAKKSGENPASQIWSYSDDSLSLCLFDISFPSSPASTYIKLISHKLFVTYSFFFWSWWWREQDRGELGACFVWLSTPCATLVMFHIFDLQHRQQVLSCFSCLMVGQNSGALNYWPKGTFSSLGVFRFHHVKGWEAEGPSVTEQPTGQVYWLCLGCGPNPLLPLTSCGKQAAASRL